MAGFSLSHATHITPSFAAAMTEWIQRSLPCRIKGIHIVNQPFIFKMVYAIFKPFLLVSFFPFQFYQFRKVQCVHLLLSSLNEVKKKKNLDCLIDR